MFHNIQIKEGAFLVSDAHYSHLRPHFLDFLKEIRSKKLLPTQLILMGDIFDALFGGVSYTQKINEEAIEILNAISLEIEVIYLEGNHDFNLQKIFPHAKIFPIAQQPLACGLNDKKVMLAHGDYGSDLGYRIYTFLVRNPVVLWILSIIDRLSNHLILNKLDAYLSKKDDCKEFKGFKKFVSKRVENRFICDYFAEGHFHQNKSIHFENFTYINLGAFACNQRYFIVKSSPEVEILEEKIFSKGIKK
ncbi:UDP-2,3-diacylglucosamine hydrolase [bacterium]|nr:UDP-2,3-diacylglucosamine hydrolase [bacterium]MBU1994687.1 UDP-2,3-diacylglucosamine hydrolase [bacterium]